MRRYRRQVHFRHPTRQQRQLEQHQSATMTSQQESEDEYVSIPSLFRKPPPLQDPIVSSTTVAQQETIDECLPFLTAALDPTENPLQYNEFGIPKLRVEDHVDFLHQNLSQFPARYVGYDASRPWLVYWGLLSLYLLGEDVQFARRRWVRSQPFQWCYDQQFRVLSTFFALQNPTGGFGGGFGHNVSERCVSMFRTADTASKVTFSNHIWFATKYCNGRRDR